MEQEKREQLEAELEALIAKFGDSQDPKFSDVKHEICLCNFVIPYKMELICFLMLTRYFTKNLGVNLYKETNYMVDPVWIKNFYKKYSKIYNKDGYRNVFQSIEFSDFLLKPPQEIVRTYLEDFISDLKPDIIKIGSVSELIGYKNERFRTGSSEAVFIPSELLHFSNIATEDGEDPLSQIFYIEPREDLKYELSWMILYSTNTNNNPSNGCFQLLMYHDYNDSDHVRTVFYRDHSHIWIRRDCSDLIDGTIIAVGYHKNQELLKYAIKTELGDNLLVNYYNKIDKHFCNLSQNILNLMENEASKIVEALKGESPMKVSDFKNIIKIIFSNGLFVPYFYFYMQPNFLSYSKKDQATLIDSYLLWEKINYSSSQSFIQEYFNCFTEKFYFNFEFLKKLKVLIEQMNYFCSLLAQFMSYKDENRTIPELVNQLLFVRANIPKETKLTIFMREFVFQMIRSLINRNNYRDESIVVVGMTLAFGKDGAKCINTNKDNVILDTISSKIDQYNNSDNIANHFALQLGQKISKRKCQEYIRNLSDQIEDFILDDEIRMLDRPCNNRIDQSTFSTDPFINDIS